jgi:hypothetical protein
VRCVNLEIVLSCLGFGFSKSFWEAMLFRTMGGALNGNVGVMRTMVSEIIQEKKSVLTIRFPNVRY